MFSSPILSSQDFMALHGKQIPRRDQILKDGHAPGKQNAVKELSYEMQLIVGGPFDDFRIKSLDPISWEVRLLVAGPFDDDKPKLFYRQFLWELSGVYDQKPEAQFYIHPNAFPGAPQANFVTVLVDQPMRLITVDEVKINDAFRRIWVLEWLFRFVLKASSEMHEGDFVLLTASETPLWCSGFYPDRAYCEELDVIDRIVEAGDLDNAISMIEFFRDNLISCSQTLLLKIKWKPCAEGIVGQFNEWMELTNKLLSYLEQKKPKQIVLQSRDDETSSPHEKKRKKEHKEKKHKSHKKERKH
jgi:hypothetical protein